MTNNKPFKIIHLSDLHLTKTDNTSRSEPKLFGALKGMNAAFRQIVKDTAVQNSDMVIVTGDVTDRGDIESWRIFWDIIKNAGLTKRTHVIPGNHDVCCLGARLPRFSGKGYADKDLKKVISGLSIGRQSIKFPWVKVLDERVAVFGMNSNNLGNYTALDNAIGELSYYQLLSLADKLRKYRDVPVKIIALHHSPNIPEIKTAKKRGQKPLSNFERLTLQIPEGHRHGLRLLCVTHRVRLIIHGHLHMSEDRRVNGIRIIGAPASTQPVKLTQTKNGYQFPMYVVRGSGGRVEYKLHTVRT